MNRKGFLLAEETLKIIIAVIAISFLIYFLVSIYFAKVNGDRAKQADALLTGSQENLNIIFKNLAEGETRDLGVIEPKGWSFFSFADGDLKPNVCGGVNCLCICDEVLWDGFNNDRQQNECSNKGKCLVNEEIGKFDSIKITGKLKVLKITKTNGRIYFSE